MTSVQAGEVEAVHAVTTDQRATTSSSSTVEGQTDILTMGLPYICPYNVNSIMNPILVMCLGLGYFFNLYRGKPLVREGGVVIMSHPTPWEFHPVHHPSYIDFFEQVLAETTDPLEIEKSSRSHFATDEWYRHLYRTSYAYHGVHPFYMWYWGAHALAAPRPGDHRRRRRQRPCAASASSRRRPCDDALEMAEDVVGRDPTHHPPAQPADPDGRRALMAPSSSASPASAASSLLGRVRSARFPLGRPAVAGVGRRARTPSARSASTTTTSGRAATRCAWPGP